MDVPFVDLPRVFHVGTLDPASRGKGARRLGSQEGACLSVSVCPNAWARIARLGGEAWWALDNGAGRFVDAHAVMDDEAAFEAVVRWGMASGLCERRDAWRCWHHDDETETWGYLTLGSREDAMGEFTGEDVGTSGPADGPAVEPFRTLAALPALEREVGGLGGASAADLLLIAWARHAAPGLAGTAVDGVWWRETHDVAALSAPRGALLPEAVSRWTPRAIPAGSVDDDDLLAAMPDAPALPAGPGP